MGGRATIKGSLLITDIDLFIVTTCYIIRTQVESSDRRLPLPPRGKRLRHRLHPVQDPGYHLLHHPLRDRQARQQLRGGRGRRGGRGGC